MDTLSYVVFLVITLLFAFILTWLLKLTAFRYVPWAMSLPWYWWVIIFTLGAFAMYGIGLPVTQWYAGFFDWLAKVMASGGAA